MPISKEEIECNKRVEEARLRRKWREEQAEDAADFRKGSAKTMVGASTNYYPYPNFRH